MKYQTLENNGAAMTFREIDERLGWKEGNAHACFMNAMKKLRTRPHEVMRLQQLVQFANRELRTQRPLRIQRQRVQAQGYMARFSDLRELVEP